MGMVRLEMVRRDLRRIPFFPRSMIFGVYLLIFLGSWMITWTMFLRSVQLLNFGVGGQPKAPQTNKNMVKICTPRKTWNLKLMVSKRNLPFQGAIFRFHLKLWEGMHCLCHFLGGFNKCKWLWSWVVWSAKSMGNPVAQRINIKSSTPSH